MTPPNGLRPKLFCKTVTNTRYIPSERQIAHETHGKIMSTSTKTPHLLGVFLFATTLFLFSAPEAAAADVYRGQWNNRKFNTKGSLVATLTKGQGDQWTGVFTGIALGKNFRYTTNFTEKKQGNRTMLIGNSNVDGDSYKWAAYLTGTTLSGSYRASNGNNGNFSGRKN